MHTGTPSMRCPVACPSHNRSAPRSQASPPTWVPPLTPRSPQKRLSRGHQCTNGYLPRFKPMIASPATEIFASHLQEKETNSRYTKKGRARKGKKSKQKGQ
ncbi:hypothetical protein GOBAR_AA26175 [Gossypium barbadense]|uniref:Uncharacterized protein n=1 Tax=Gossypium barbadense TaxID=3634 RepID=A0A2P5WTS5_GOSBA|nr:hypothetical protein GOBAR_AA26175 [Gossypium barbadense]